MKCIKCNSDNLRRLGMRFMGNLKGSGYQCYDCDEKFVVPKEEIIEEVNDDLFYVKDDKYIEKIKSNKKIIFTSAVNDCEVNKKFFNSLLKYTEFNKASFVVFPIKYKNPSAFNVEQNVKYDPLISEYLVENNFEIIENLNALGALKIQATTENPLSGIDGLSKGSSLIIGHPQVALKTLPRNSEKYPAIVTTTGCVTNKTYSTTKQGYKANFNHSLSAIILEIDEDNKHFYIRHLNFDGEGFYDLNYYANEFGVRKYSEKIEGLVTGDEHAYFADESVINATYLNDDSIVKTLKPKYIVRHDVLDFFSGSHHHRKDIFLKYAKFHSKMSCVIKELDTTIDFINRTTPKDSTNIIIASNHNEHLMRWLNEFDVKTDSENALIYHKLMYEMLLDTYMDGSNISVPEPFELYAKDKLKNSKFLSRNESMKISDIEISNHGDRGVAGTKGTSKQFSNIPVKTITGHTHSPVIDKGNYTVGTSSRFDLSYVSGLSKWHHAHCLIYPNGKRQMIFIVNGKWKA